MTAGIQKQLLCLRKLSTTHPFVFANKPRLPCLACSTSQPYHALYMVLHSIYRATSVHRYAHSILNSNKKAICNTEYQDRRRMKDNSRFLKTAIHTRKETLQQQRNPTRLSNRRQSARPFSTFDSWCRATVHGYCRRNRSSCLQVWKSPVFHPRWLL